MEHRSKPSRLVDYALVLGLSPQDYLESNPADQEIVIRAITDLVVSYGRNPAFGHSHRASPSASHDATSSASASPASSASSAAASSAAAVYVPQLGLNRYEAVTTRSSVAANLNVGSMGSEIFLYQHRSAVSHTPSTGTLVVNAGERTPITGVAVIYADRGETPPSGYVVLEGNVNKGSFGRTVHICVERSEDKMPLTDVMVVDEDAGETCPPEYERIDKNLNQGALGHQIYLCFRRASRASISDVTYPISILSRFPQTDFASNPLPENGLSMLCFPTGLKLRTDMELPQFFSFVVTGGKGEEVYCAVLKFYEPLPVHLLERRARREAQEEQRYREQLAHASGDDSSPSSTPPPATPHSTSSSHGTRGFALVRSESGATRLFFAPKCVCLVSHWPFYSVFAGFLKQIYQISLSPSPLPIERYFGDFMSHVPFPPAGGPATVYRIGHSRLALARPSAFFFPVRDYSFRPLFECLSVINILKLFSHVLAERKVVLYSNSYDVLTPIAEALRALLFPLQWQFAFIPVLPSKLAYVLRAPVPVLIGIHRTFLEDVGVADDVVLVDLDRNQISVPVSDGSGSTHRPSGGGSASDVHASAPGEGQTVYIPDVLFNGMLQQLQECANVFVGRDRSSESSSIYVPRSARTLSGGSELEAMAASARGMDSGDRTSSQDSLGDLHVAETFDEQEIQDIFLRFFVFLLHDYRAFLQPPNSEDDEELLMAHLPFDSRGFEKRFPHEMRRFVRQLTSTQAFASFVMDRSLPTVDLSRAMQLHFFDWCIAIDTEPTIDELYYARLEAELTGSRKPPIKVEALPERVKAHQQGDSPRLYRYETFPCLDPGLFQCSDEFLNSDAAPLPPGSPEALARHGSKNDGETADLHRRVEVLCTAVIRAANQNVQLQREREAQRKRRARKREERARRKRHKQRAHRLQHIDSADAIQVPQRSPPRTHRRMHTAAAPASRTAASPQHDASDSDADSASDDELDEIIPAHINIDGRSWPITQIVSAYQMWFLLHLDRDRQVRPDECLAQLVVALRQLLKLCRLLHEAKAPLSDRSLVNPLIIEDLCSFCMRHRLFLPFQMIYRVQASLYPGWTPPVSFFKRCTVESQSDYEPRPIPDFARKKYEQPALMSIGAHCLSCKTPMLPEMLMMGLDVPRLKAMALDRLLAQSGDDDKSRRKSKSKKRSALLVLVSNLYKKGAQKAAKQREAEQQQQQQQPASPKDKKKSKKSKKKKEKQSHRPKGDSAVMMQPRKHAAQRGDPVSEASDHDEPSDDEQDDVVKQLVEPIDYLRACCPACRTLTISPCLTIDLGRLSNDDDDLVLASRDVPSLGGEKLNLTFFAPTLLCEALSAKRRTQQQREEKRRAKAKKNASSPTAAPAPSSSSSTVSLKDLNVHEWVQFEKALFWNLFWIFAALDMPVINIWRNYGEDGTPNSSLTLAPNPPEPTPLADARRSASTILVELAPNVDVCTLPSGSWAVIPRDPEQASKVALFVDDIDPDAPKAPPTPSSSGPPPLRLSDDASPPQLSVDTSTPTSKGSRKKSHLSVATHHRSSSSGTTSPLYQSFVPSPRPGGGKGTLRGQPTHMYLRTLSSLRAFFRSGHHTGEQVVEALESMRILLSEPLEGPGSSAGVSGSNAPHIARVRTADTATISRQSFTAPRVAASSSTLVPSQMTKLEHVGQSERVKSDGYKLLVSLARLLEQYGYSGASAQQKQGKSSKERKHARRSSGKNKARTLRHVQESVSRLNVVAAVLHLLCEISSVQPSANLLRDIDAGVQIISDGLALGETERRLGLPFPALYGSPKHASEGGSRSHSRSDSNASSTTKPVTKEPELLAKLLRILVEVVSMNLANPLIVKAGVLVLSNALLVLPNTRRQRTRLHLMQSGTGSSMLDVTVTAMRRHHGDPVVLDACAYFLAVATSVSDGFVVKLDSQGGLRVLIASAQKHIGELHFMESALRVLLNALRSNRSGASAGSSSDASQLAHMGLTSILASVVFKFAYLAQHQRPLVHFGVMGEAFSCIEELAKRPETVALLAEEGMVKAACAVLANPAMVLPDEAHSLLPTHGLAAMPRGAQAGSTGSSPSSQSNTSASSAGVSPSTSNMSLDSALKVPLPSTLRANNWHQSALDAQAVRVLASMLSFPTHKIVRRVASMVCGEEGVVTIMQHCRAVVADWMQNSSTLPDVGALGPFERSSLTVLEQALSLALHFAPAATANMFHLITQTPVHVLEETAELLTLVLRLQSDDPHLNVLMQWFPSAKDIVPRTIFGLGNLVSVLSTVSEKLAQNKDGVGSLYLSKLGHRGLSHGVVEELDESSDEDGDDEAAVDTNVIGGPDSTSGRSSGDDSPKAAKMSRRMSHSRNSPSKLSMSTSSRFDRIRSTAIKLVHSLTASVDAFCRENPDAIQNQRLLLRKFARAIAAFEQSCGVLDHASSDESESDDEAGHQRSRSVLQSSSQNLLKLAQHHMSDVVLAVSESARRAMSPLMLPRRVDKAAEEDNGNDEEDPLDAVAAASVGLETKSPTSAETRGSESFSPWSKLNLSRVLELKGGPKPGMRKLFSRTASQVQLHEDPLSLQRSCSIPSVRFTALGASSTDSSVCLLGEVDNADVGRTESPNTVSTSFGSPPALYGTLSEPVGKRYTQRLERLSASPAEGTMSEHERAWMRVLEETEAELATLRASAEAAGQVPTTTLADLLRRRTAEVDALVLEGIPAQFRYRLWSTFSGADELRSQHPLNYYDQLVTAYEEHGSEYQGEIEQDLHRTLVQVPFFHTEEAQSALRRVLGAYSLMDPDVVGYCQSMNDLAGTLLSYLEEEEAFWVLAAMVLNHVGNYTKTMCSLVVDQRVLEDLFALTQPELRDFLQANGINMSMFTVRWFMCMFVEAPFPFEQSARVWDSLLYVGDEMIFRVALELMSFHSATMRACDDFAQLFDFCLHDGIRKGLDVDVILRRVYALRAQARAETSASGSNSALSPTFASPPLSPLGPASLTHTTHAPPPSDMWHRIVVLRKFHRAQVLLENREIDASSAQHLMHQFHFASQEEIQRLWQHFLSPSPWKILQEASICSVLHFHQAFCPFVYSDAHRAKWREHGLFSGVVHRLFRVLDVHESGRVSMIDFLRGVSILTKQPVDKRLKLCFDYFDLDENGIVDRSEVVDIFSMFQLMYCGEGHRDDAEELMRTCFANAQCHLEDTLNYSCFRKSISGNPFVRCFFRLGTDQEIQELLESDVFCTTT